MSKIYTLEIRTNILVKVSLIVIFIFGLSSISLAGIATSKQAYEMIDKVRKVLIENGYCKGNCTVGRHTFFVGPVTEGFHVIVHNITSENIIKEINNIATNIYFKNNQKITIKNRFYRTAHKDTIVIGPSFLKWLFGDDEFIIFELIKKGEIQ